MKKKRIIIVLILIVVIVALRIILPSMKSKDPINSSYNQYQKVQEFVSNEKGTDPNVEIKTNEGGYSGVLISNKSSLLKVMNTDSMLKVDKRLSESLNYINQLKKTKDINTRNFFNQNKDNIALYLGISEESTYLKFVSDISFINDNDKLKIAAIDESSVKKVEGKDGEIKFNLNLKTDNNKNQMFNITVILDVNNQKDINLIWS